MNEKQEMDAALKEEIDNMTPEQKKEFVESMFERYKVNVWEKDGKNRAKRRSPVSAVRTKNRSKNRLAAKSRAKNRK